MSTVFSPSSASVGMGTAADRGIGRTSRFDGSRSLATMPYRIEYIDLRYPNGYAVRMKGVSTVDAATAAKNAALAAAAAARAASRPAPQTTPTPK